MWDKEVQKDVEENLSILRSIFGDATEKIPDPEIEKKIIRKIIALTNIEHLLEDLKDFAEGLNSFRNLMANYISVLEGNVDINEFLDKYGYIADYIEDKNISLDQKLADIHEDVCRDLADIIIRFKTFSYIVQDIVEKAELMLFSLIAVRRIK